MSTNIDDPLADLLSDNSLDNETFFESAANRRPQTSTTTGRLSNTTKTSSKSKIDDLFGIREEASNTLRVPDAVNESTPTATSTPRKMKQHGKDDTHAQLDKDDDDDLGFDPKKPKSGPKRDLLDDLLGPITGDKKPTTATAPATTLKAPISRQSTDTTTDTSHVMAARPKTSSGRRSSGTSALADPLGLFGAAAAATAASGNKHNLPSSSGVSTPMQKKRSMGGAGAGVSSSAFASSTANWLGLGLGSAAEPDPGDIVNTTRDSRLGSPAPRPTVKQYDGESAEKLPDATLMAQEPDAADGSSAAHNILLLNNMAAEANASFALLQQQEANLLMASQMNTHEKALLEIKQRQEAMMKHQEMQFQALIQQQVQRQRQMEEHIKQQQQRINSHLQLMLIQPSATPSTMAEDRHGDITSNTLVNECGGGGAAGGVTTNAIEVVEMEANLKRLELERLRLEELLDNLKANYEQELEAVKSSYKKQLKVLEEHLQIVENRLKVDMEEQRQYFLKKVQLLESDSAKAKVDYETTIANLKQEHEDDVRKWRKSHEQDMDMLKEEHRRMLDNVRQAKFMEFALVQENGSYLQTLRSASSNLEQLSGGLQELRDDMQLRMDTLQMERQAKLEARERRIEDAERRLKIGEEKSEAERKHLIELVGSLELQLGSMTKERCDEQWLVRQKMSTLEAERSAFEKEKAYVREQLARDEKRLADLKESQLGEHQRIALDLQEQQTKLSIERTKLETKLLLNPDPNGEQQKAQLEAAMEVARDATKQADLERERFRQMQRQLEQARRQFVDDENLLQAKRDELEIEIRSFQLARQKAEAELLQAKAEEQNYQTKTLFLSERAREINNREAELSEERLAVTRERVELEEAKRSLHKKCVLCDMNAQNEQITRQLNPNQSQNHSHSQSQSQNQSQSQSQAAGEQKPQVTSILDLTLDAETKAALNRAFSTPANGSAPFIASGGGAFAKNAKVMDANEYRAFLQRFDESSDIVDRLLDENIEESYRRMHSSIGGYE